ncbi:branched-chain amino acid ABC transporter permease [Prauserella halophila]|uniref:Branched-chain amino acid ABC transporter permease n=1 Tax=Prauserella halophila TaxID=185641 RepID=A0ABP4H2G1_9PSEU|nr:branched-chain amino acid ABC transporter permease [Prauserella halophila]MCP2238083.1 amino acid/amide ABC transporter membrane protein 2, HAAT family [Prauserella halophila]
MTTNVSPQRLGTLLVALALLLAPLALTGQDYVLRVLTVGATYAIAVYGMNMILGLTGQLSLAHGGFFGIGVYLVGLLTTDYDWAFWPALLVAVVGTTVVGYVAGVVALRTREEYFAIFTMAMGFIIFLVISRWESVTHAHSGVSGVKYPESLGLLDFSDPMLMYYLVLLFLLGAGYVTYAVRRSGVGRTLIAIRTSEDLARSVGVNVGLNKQLAFAASSTFAGLGGGLFAAVQGFVGPSAASVDLTFEMLMFILVGGMGTVMGPVVGTFLVLFLFEFFQDFEAYRFIVVGPIIVALVIFAPRGIVGYLNAFAGHRRSRGPAGGNETGNRSENRVPDTTTEAKETL